MDSLKIMREQINKKIVNNFKSGDIIYRDANWLQRYSRNYRLHILASLEPNIIKGAYGLKCPYCNYHTGFFNSRREARSFIGFSDFCDECNEVMDEVYEYRKI